MGLRGAVGLWIVLRWLNDDVGEIPSLMFLAAIRIPGSFPVTLSRNLAMSSVMTQHRVHSPPVILVSSNQTRLGREVGLLQSYRVSRVTLDKVEIMCDVLFVSEGVPSFTTLSLAWYPTVGGVGYDGVVPPTTIVLVPQF